MPTDMPRAQEPMERRDAAAVQAFRINFNRCVIRREDAAKDNKAEPDYGGLTASAIETRRIP